jgi:3-hydroxyacyl-CoA dehydrogenase
MGKAFLVILLIAVAAFFIYKQTHHPASDEELKVEAVEERFISASNRFMGSAAGGAAAGLDVVEEAAVEVQKTRAELTRLAKTLTEPKAILKAEELRAKIDVFCRKNDIR